MSASPIQWTHITCNCVAGCDDASPGCLNCYAKEIARRMEAGLAGPQAGKQASARQLAVMNQYEGLTSCSVHTDRFGKERKVVKWTGKIGINVEPLRDLLKVRAKKRVFIASMGDLFHKDVPRDLQLAVLAVAAVRDNLTLQLVTKRAHVMLERFTELDADLPERERQATTLGVTRAARLMDAAHRMGLGLLVSSTTPYPLRNVHLIVSTEDQARLDERVPLLLKCPAVVHGISAEPLLGPLKISPYLYGLNGSRFLRWVIPGGESHKIRDKARPCDLEWVRDILRQIWIAREQGSHVAPFVKQLGSHPVGDFNDLTPGMQHHHRHADRKQRFRLILEDGHGGDASEWPRDLRGFDGLGIREFPVPEGEYVTA